MLAAVSFFSVKANAISAEKAIVMDADTGRVLYECRSQERSLIASTTKIMTALIVCEQCNVLDRVRVPEEAVGVEGSSMYLQPGEVLTVQELLYGLMLSSGNDAAVALAIYCAGSVERFVQLMNDKARLLGLENTHFENPHGLDAEAHYSTAADLAALAAYAMKNPIFSQTVSTKNVSVGERCITNHNKLLWRLDGAEGVKTGYTKAAGRILVSSVSRDGRRLVAVTINAPDDWNDHCVLIENAFSRYKPQTLVTQGGVVGVLEVVSGEGSSVEILAGESYDCPVAEDEQVTIKLSGSGFVFAPVKAGTDAGYAYIFVDDAPVGKIPVVYGSSVEQITGEEKPLVKRLFGG